MSLYYQLMSAANKHAIPTDVFRCNKRETPTGVVIIDELGAYNASVLFTKNKYETEIRQHIYGETGDPKARAITSIGSFKKLDMGCSHIIIPIDVDNPEAELFVWVQGSTRSTYVSDGKDVYEWFHIDNAGILVNLEDNRACCDIANAIFEYIIHNKIELIQ